MSKRSYTEEGDGDIEVDFEDYEEDYFEGKKPRRPRAVKEVKDYLKTHAQDKTYKRVAAAAKKHPGASLYELQHGIKSKASQAYRARQAPARPVIDHAEIHRAFRESGFVVLKDGAYNPGPITAVHGKKVVLYGGTFVYHPDRDKHRRYNRITEELLSQVQMHLKTE
jgi:hypothetical protein